MGKKVQPMIYISMLTYFIFAGIISCQKQPPKKVAAQTNATEHTTDVANKTLGNEKKQNDTIPKKLLKGVWGRAISENANFEILMDTIYYIDADRRLGYTLSDSTIVVYEESGDTSFALSILKLNKETMILVNKDLQDTSVYSRFN